MLRWILLFVTLTSAGWAQERRPSHCIALVDNTPPPAILMRASFRDPIDQDHVRITYIDHSMFLIQGPEGTSVVTDYAGFLGGAVASCPRRSP